MSKGPINPQDGLGPDDYVDPPLPKPNTSSLPNLEALGPFAGEKVAKLGVADAREVRLLLQKCLTTASFARYKERSKCPVKSRKDDVVKDIRLLLEILHNQGPTDMVRIEKITNALRLGMSVEAIGDKFNLPINRLREAGPSAEPGLPDEMLRLLAAALVVMSNNLEGHKVLTKLTESFSAQQAQEIVGAAQ